MIMERIRETANKEFRHMRKEDLPIRAILCYPGWYIDYTRTDCNGFYITNDELLLQYLRKREPVWNQEQTSSMAQMLGEYMRKNRMDILLEE